MKRKLVIFQMGVVLLFCGIFFLRTVHGADIRGFDYKEFARIPVLDQGRVKPLDTFARTYLEGFYGRDSLNGMPAIEWLAEMLFDPDKAGQRQIFNIPNMSVGDALELGHREKHRYSYQEVSQAMTNHFKAWHSLFLKPKEELTLEQQQLVALFNKSQLYADISRSFSMVFPEFEISSESLASLFGVKVGSKLTYLDVNKKQFELQEKAKQILAKIEAGDQDISAEEMEVSTIAHKMSEISRDQNSSLLRVIPPQWDNQSGLWFAPWGISQEGGGSPQTADYLRKWKELCRAYRYGDTVQWARSAQAIRVQALMMAGERVSGGKIALEVSFNHWGLFARSLSLYLSAFLVILASFLFWQRLMRIFAFALLFCGFITHVTGILIRMYIMQRPPVTNLYESIIFVAFIAVFFGMVLEWRKKNSMGIIIASAVGTILHFIGLKYDTDGDTMGMLTAVLNTNFWLSTHVVCITIGYGCCLVCGVIGHVYLIYRLIKPEDRERLADFYKNLQGASIVALFFASLGTILGGIWADQSWGRFWGWDPKENGALLIVLWLAWLIHGRISGKIGELGYAVGMVCTNAIVALAWFGVNLLSVGLHSYGFTQSAALNLALFCGGELIFALGCYYTIRFRRLAV